MYTDEQIAKLEPKNHPAIIMADSWGGYISDKEYDRKFEDFKTWAFKTKQIIMEKYGEEAGDDFLSIFATSEIRPFLKAGFQLDYDYLDKLVEECPAEKKLPFLKQELTRKLFPIRESATIIALNSNAIWGAKKEFSDTGQLAANIKEINKHSINSLILLATGKASGLEYLSKIVKRMQEISKCEIPPTEHYIKVLKTFDKKLNECYYEETTLGFINTPN